MHSRAAITLLTILHLLVDALCVCALFVGLPTVAGAGSWCVLLAYNVLAFMGQPLVGVWADRQGNPRQSLAVATLLLGVGGLLSWLSAPGLGQSLHYPATVLLGMGNAVFHVYGGVFVAHVTHNDIRQLGIFVSTGAVGLVLGRVFCSPLLLAVLWVLVAVCAWRVLHEAKHHDAGGAAQGREPLALEVGSETGGLAVGRRTQLLMLVGIVLLVMARSFWGRVLPEPEAESLVGMLTFALLAMAGKASGGYVARRYGASRTLVVSLLLAGVGFLLCDYGDAWIGLTLLLVNVSMPITLYWANRLLRGHEGVAFGLLAAALLPGYVLALAYDASMLPSSLLELLVGTVVIEGAVLLALRERRWQVLGAMTLINIATNVPLNLWADAYDPGWCEILCLEALIVVVEALLYWPVLRNLRESWLYAGLCNAFSFGLGVLVQLLMLLLA